MFTFWWILVTFLAGGTAGILLVALIRMAGDSGQQSSIACELPASPLQRGADAVAVGHR